MRNVVHPERRPLLGVLLLLVSSLVLGSVLSSPPWAGWGPWLGLPEDACGWVGRQVAWVTLGIFGAPVAAWLLVAGFVLAGRALLRRPHNPFRFLAWSAALAGSASLLLALLDRGALWGELPRDLAGRLGSRGFLGPLGAFLLLLSLLLAVLILGLQRWLPGPARDLLFRGASAPFHALRAGLEGVVTALGNVRERRARAVERAASAPPAKEPEPWKPEFLQEERPASRAAREKPRPKPARAAAQPSPGGYVLPPVSLLEEDTTPPVPVDRDEIQDNGRTLVRALRDFGIEGQLGQVHPGPVVTQYEFEPAAGVKISQIVSRGEDLALALRASRVRLVAPIPGKGAVGIEVPNRAATRITLRGLLKEIDPLGLPGDLPLVFGRDIRGQAYTHRLDVMPHLLVAGTTGSGKSVCLNALLLSLLFRRTPEELRLLLIDPKMLELTPYDGIPHLLCPVVTEAKMAARMLGWLVTEMERRYRRMAGLGVRNIEGYRAKLRTAKAAEGLEPMPYIVVIVDELADLMMTVANEVEGPIARLAQMARAVGIHLILATQRPSVDVITGVIKANFPARIAFQVASKVDSRTILDCNGAESLLGRGDMLFLPPGKAEAIRVHGAFVSEADTEAVVQFLKPQPEAPAIFREEALSAEGGEGSFEDEMFEDALRLIVTQKMASTSFLQRRLKVGYSRAGRLMDLLERSGAVGPQDGSKAREVLADERFLEDWLARERARESGAPR